MTVSICCDALNPANAPTPDKLLTLGVDGVRLTLLNQEPFFDYYFQLKESGLYVAVQSASESYASYDYEGETAAYAERLSSNPPDLWLLANEANAQITARGNFASATTARLPRVAGPHIPFAPKGTAQDWYKKVAAHNSRRHQLKMAGRRFGAAEEPVISSWIMDVPTLSAYFAASVHGLRSVLPDARAYLGGMLGSASDYIDQTLTALAQIDGMPNGIDVHYPDSAEVLQSYMIYGLPLSVMEWCYAGARVSRRAVVKWLALLHQYTNDTAWFDWGYDPSMAVVGPQGQPLKAFWDLQAAIKQLYRAS